MAYITIEAFSDLQDNKHPYMVGDFYPRDGKKASKKRIAELASSANRIGRPLIREIPDQEEAPDPTVEQERTEE